MYSRFSYPQHLGSMCYHRFSNLACRTFSHSAAEKLDNNPSAVISHLCPVFARVTNTIAERGKGSYVWTTDGDRYLDFTSGIGVTSTGHCHPRVVEALKAQVETILHPQQNVFGSSQIQIELIKRLLRIVPTGLETFLFANSGAEAVENAIKISRGHTKKANIIAFHGGFHGRTIGAMSLTSSKTVYRQGFQPLMPGAIIAPFPYCLKCPQQNKDNACCARYEYDLEMLFKQVVAPSEAAAMIIEPILGEGGFIVPPPGFLQHLRHLCDMHQVLLIFDEVQSGVGRTGRWWASQHEEVNPDIMLFAKGIASGIPLSGVACRPEIMANMDPGTLGGTYGGNAVASAAAVATIDVIENEGILENVTSRGIQLVAKLNELSKKYPIIDVRGRGLMVAVEFEGKYTGVAGKITESCSKKKLLMMTAGASEIIRFLPPLTVSANELDDGLIIFEKVLEETFC